MNGPRFVEQINTTSSNKDEVLNILIGQLENYLDNSYDVKGTGISYKKGVNKIMKDMHALVIDTLNPYQVYVKKDFEGFSDDIRSKLEFLGKVNWKSTKTGDVFVDSDLVGQDYIRARMNELKEQIKTELLLYSHLHLDDFGDVDPETKLPEDTVLTFDPNEVLIPLDDELIEMPESDMMLTVAEVDVTGTMPVNVGNTVSQRIDPDLAERILQIMSSNNQLIEKISEEMSLMRLTMEDMRREGEERDRAMYNDLNNKYLGLKDAIAQLQKDGSIDLNFASAQPIENKSNVEIKFGYGSVYLSATNKVKLNTVFSDMLRNPRYKLIITGYADSSGNREQNILLSQKRANAVKFHLRKMGVSENRMVMNYLGDTGSESYDPDDRKVVIEWLEEIDLGNSIFPE
ncbi:MAG: OmpA family protein [Flavobacteriales bacterium]|nr:OmpA family protein [Flavobacteriales bacterium]